MKKWILAAVLLLTGTFAFGYDTTPLQIGIWPPALQVVTPEIDVSGLKLNLPYGGNDNVAGLDIGLVSTAKNNSSIQINAFLNLVDEDYAGVQVGLFNLCGDSAGLQIGLLNSTDRVASGLQIAVINSTLEMHGVQIGLINYTQFMTGLQLGVVNIITDSIVPGMIIFNFCF